MSNIYYYILSRFTFFHSTLLNDTNKIFLYIKVINDNELLSKIVASSASSEAIYETIPSESSTPPVKPPRLRDLVKMNPEPTEELLERPMSAPPRPNHLPLDSTSADKGEYEFLCLDYVK